MQIYSCSDISLVELNRKVFYAYFTKKELFCDSNKKLPHLMQFYDGEKSDFLSYFDKHQRSRGMRWEKKLNYKAKTLAMMMAIVKKAERQKKT